MKLYYVFVRVHGRTLMSKVPDDDLFCRECQTVNVREVSRKKYPDKIEVFVICEVCKTHSVCVIIKEEENELRKFPGGATRSADADNERYDLISPHATKREAIRMAEGAATHGERNWETGVPISVCINHLERHLVQYKMGDRSTDHLAAIRCNAGFLIHFEEQITTETDNDGIADSEIVGFNYPEYPRSTTIQSRGEAHLDGSLRSTSKKR
jgi:hypothetical protein